MKLHPLSIPYRAVSRGTSVGFTLIFVGLSLSGSDLLPVELTEPRLAALALVGVAAVAGWQYAYYRRFEYELTDEGLEIASGVVSRRNREIPLGRVQNVDISRNLVQRALGIAALDLETAGGGQTEASLRYVGYDEAKRLQREIQQRKRRLEAEPSASTDENAETVETGEGEPDHGVPPDHRFEPDREELLFELELGELALLSVLSLNFRYLSILAFGPAAFPFVPGFAEVAFVGGLMLLALLAVGVWSISAAVTFARYYDFRLTRVGDELRYERGLLQRYDGSIPLSKVQTLTLRESALMRPFGYASLAVETAGYGPGQAPFGGSEAAIPLATRDRVLRLANEVETFDPPEFSRPPERARTRYAVRYVFALAGVTALLLGLRAVVGIPGEQYLALAPLALVLLVPVAAHLKWANRGYARGEDHVFTRNGFWNRTTKVVPYYRVQTAFQTQTIFQRRRRWRLADVVVDTASSAGGVALAADLDREDAEELREFVAAKLQESLAIRAEGDRSGGRTTGQPSADSTNAERVDSESESAERTSPESRDSERTPDEEE
jgi:putative membrane protein